MKEWIASWLTKAGVNDLTTKVVEVEGKFQIKINQSLPRIGDQIFHKQIIDIGVYDDEGNENIIKDILIID